MKFDISFISQHAIKVSSNNKVIKTEWTFSLSIFGSDGRGLKKGSPLPPVVIATSFTLHLSRCGSAFGWKTQNIAARVGEIGLSRCSKEPTPFPRDPHTGAPTNRDSAVAVFMDYTFPPSTRSGHKEENAFPQVGHFRKERFSERRPLFPKEKRISGLNIPRDVTGPNQNNTRRAGFRFRCEEKAGCTRLYRRNRMQKKISDSVATPPCHVRPTNQDTHSPGRPNHIRPHTLSRYGMEERFAFRFPVTPSIIKSRLFCLLAFM
ncbi:hypothetical protein TNCV_3009901 [Trichonephila clavipes]|nr:hypothetical protein TNCV_3009901 [Trichonephila clavipes]